MLGKRCSGSLGQRAPQHVAHVRRHVRRQLLDGWRLGADHLAQHVHHVVAGERRATGQHFVGDDGERVLVAAVIDLRGLTQRLLGRHVVGRAQDVVLAGQALAAASALADAEVEQLHQLRLGPARCVRKMFAGFRSR